MHLKFSDESLESRVAQFKKDPEKMADLTIFIDEILDEAQQKAQQKEGGTVVRHIPKVWIDEEQIKNISMFRFISRLTNQNLQAEMVSSKSHINRILFVKIGLVW
jgi:6-phosphogluconate dehydrogenase